MIKKKLKQPKLNTYRVWQLARTWTVIIIHWYAHLLDTSCFLVGMTEGSAEIDTKEFGDVFEAYVDVSEVCGTDCVVWALLAAVTGSKVIFLKPWNSRHLSSITHYIFTGTCWNANFKC